MPTAFDGVAARGHLRYPVGLYPGHGSSQHAKVQMILYCLRMASLRLGAADITFEFFKQGFDLPAGTLVFKNLANRNARVGRKQSDPLTLAIDPDHLDRTFYRLEHHHLVIGDNGALTAIQIHGDGLWARGLKSAASEAAVCSFALYLRGRPARP